MITKFPNSPRFFVRQNLRGLWEIIDSHSGRYEIASNDEARMREYCHGFNYPYGGLPYRDTFADDCQGDAC